MIIFLWILNRRLHGLPLKEWGQSLLKLIAISGIAGTGSWIISLAWEQLLGSNNLLLQLLQLTLALGVAFGLFIVLSMQLKLPEVEILLSRISQKFNKT